MVDTVAKVLFEILNSIKAAAARTARGAHRSGSAPLGELGALGVGGSGESCLEGSLDGRGPWMAD